jgi:hypothetical protein
MKSILDAAAYKADHHAMQLGGAGLGAGVFEERDNFAVIG